MTNRKVIAASTQMNPPTGNPGTSETGRTRDRSRLVDHLQTLQHRVNFRQKLIWFALPTAPPRWCQPRIGGMAHLRARRRIASCGLSEGGRVAS